MHTSSVTRGTLSISRSSPEADCYTSLASISSDSFISQNITIDKNSLANLGTCTLPKLVSSYIKKYFVEPVHKKWNSCLYVSRSRSMHMHAYPPRWKFASYLGRETYARVQLWNASKLNIEQLELAPFADDVDVASDQEIIFKTMITCYHDLDFVPIDKYPTRNQVMCA